MTEHRESVDKALQEKAEADFAEAVARATESDPFSSSRPLKYETGSRIYVKGVGETFLVQKGKAGVYLLQGQSGKLAVCLETLMSLVQ